MRPGADVELAVLADLHAAVAIFGSEAEEALTSAALGIRHAADWIEDMTRHWTTEKRKAWDDVVQAKADLSMRRFPDAVGRMPDTTLHERAVRRAEEYLDFVEGQIIRCRRRAATLTKDVEEAYYVPARGFAEFLRSDLPRAQVGLADRLRSLEAYVNLRREGSA